MLYTRTVGTQTVTLSCGYCKVGAIDGPVNVTVS